MKHPITLTLTEALLGTASANPDLYRQFIQSKCPVPGEDEAESLPDVDEEVQLSTTVFRRTADGKPFIYDYQIKGFFKDACSALRRVTRFVPVKGKEPKKVAAYHSGNLKAYKKEIDGLIFVKPREILLQLPEGAELGICERSLRAQTPKGEKVSLARSEEAPAGTKLVFTINMLGDHLEDALWEWLEYGELRGLGQWRNSGKGRFTFEMEK